MLSEIANCFREHVSKNFMLYLDINFNSKATFFILTVCAFHDVRFALHLLSMDRRHDYSDKIINFLTLCAFNNE